MKAIMLSIQPKYCELIASGKKTVEIRKTRPKIETPFKCYIYETQKKINPWCNGRGKVIGEFVCDEIYNIIYYGFFAKVYTDDNLTTAIEPDDFFEMSCLNRKQIFEYLGEKSAYAWHISDLVIYDEPKELSEFKKINRDCWYADLGLAKRDCPECQNKECFIQKPFQSWGYVEEIKEC